MTDIVVDQKFCKIVNELDSDFLPKLDKHLSFRYIGAEFTPAFKYHHWDGTEKLLSRKLEFMTGLLDYVLEFYKKYDKEVNVVNKIPTFTLGPEIDLSKGLKKLGITPYDYQVDAVSRALEADRMIFKHATGSGKTLTAALITAKMGKPTAIYVISKDLLYQFHEFFTKLFNKEIGIIGDGLCDVKDISIISIQTAGRALGMKKTEILIDDDGNEKFNDSDKGKILAFMKSTKIHMFDECHCCAAKTIRNIYKTINPEKIYGFSGTPWRDDGSDLLITGMLGDKIHEVKASDLIRRKILAKPYIKFIYVKGESHFQEKYPTVYSNNVVNAHYRNNIIASETQKLINKGYQVLILFKTLKHGKILKELFESKNIDCEFLTGNDSAKVRASAKENILSGKSKCIIASMIFDIGIDLPTLNALVLAGSGKSSVKTLQRIGRVIRSGRDKPYAAIIEFLDDVRFLKKHSLIRKSIYESEPEFDINFPNIKKK